MLRSNTLLILGASTGLYVLFFFFNEPVDFKTCQLCDGKQYLKLYWYFENSEPYQSSFPFYIRPVVPFLASLIPGSNAYMAFHIINGVFMLLSVLTLHSLWRYLNLKKEIIWIGFGWLLLHWTGIIRYNIFDFVTVDVPVYFAQALALLLFFRNKYRWFYLLTPLAILQKESFVGVVMVLLAIHIWEHRSGWFREGQHLLYSILLGIVIQYMVIQLMPSQNHKWHSILTLLLTTKMTLEDPTRLIRWFAAFGSAYGVIPFLVVFKRKSFNLKNKVQISLAALSMLYLVFGLLAGEDMTRILFLGFPFIMSLSLVFLQSTHHWVMLFSILLSSVSLRLWSLPVETKWAVDYREISYVYQWSLYYLLALVALWIVFKGIANKNPNSV